MKICISALCIGDDRPPLAVGSVFYRGDKSVLDFDQGVVDWDRVAKEYEEVKSISDEYGIPIAVDLIIETEKAVDNIIPRAVDVFRDTILFLDSPSRNVRIKMYSLAKELGIVDKVVANAVTIYDVPEEFEIMKTHNLKLSVALLYDPKDSRSIYDVERRIDIAKKLVEEAKRFNIELLLDAVVLDPASIALSIRTIKRVKEELDAVVGCAPANALGNVSKAALGEIADIIHASIAVLLLGEEAHYVMYGPLRRGRYIIPALSTAYILKLYAETGRAPRTNPAYKSLKKLQQLFTRG